MRRFVFDLECNGLLDEVTLIHCLNYYDIETAESVTLTNYEDIIAFITREDIILIGHNIVKFDIPVLKKLLRINIKAQLIDTLGLSWILYPQRKKHGLEEWGEEFDVPKPVITDWNSLTIDDYIHRCKEDVKINTLLWNMQLSLLNRIYDGNINMIDRFFRYIQLKLTCVAEQEEIGVGLDVEHCRKVLAQLIAEKESKIIALKNAMPSVKKYDYKSPPKVLYKKDGTLSSNGLRWHAFLDAYELPLDHTEPVKYLKSLEEPNPGSSTQIKNWLYDLGWIPEHIKHDRNKETGEIKEIPQIKNKDADKQGEVCDSIKKLFPLEPSLEILEGLTILTHRISIFEGFLRDQKNGRLYPSMSGFTNTMRLKHTVVVNLPKIEKLYGKEVRGALIADEGKILCGSDLTNIESQTRNHYIFPYDPDYVADMTAPGFDSHLDVAKLASFITPEEEEFYKWYKKQK